MAETRALVAVGLLLQLPCADAVGQKRVARATTPVFGVVHDAAGKPVADVEVRAVAPELSGLPVFASEVFGGGFAVVGSTRTNARGRFVLRVRSVGRFSVVAIRGRTARSFVAAPVSPGSQLDLQLHPVRRVRGRVVDFRDGKRIAKAGESVWSVGPVESSVPHRAGSGRYLGVIEQAATDAKGEFELTIFADARCTIRTRHGGAVSRVEQPGESAEKRPATEEPAPIILRSMTRRIVCTIVDRDTKEPAPGARIHVGGESFRADAKGRCVAEFPRSIPIDVEADGYERIRLATTLVDEFEVSLAKTGQARMRFVDGAADRPRGGIEICVIRIARRRNHTGPLVTRVRADAAGRLVINRPAEYAVLWARVGPRFVRVLELLGGVGDVDLGDVSTATFDLRGTVLDIDGVPAAHIPVFAEPMDSEFIDRMPLARDPVAFTDHAGRFTIPGMAQRNHLLAVRTDRSFTEFVERIGPDREDPLRIRLRPAQTIRGRVVDRTGKPIASVLVSTYPREEVDDRFRHFGLFGVSALTDANGEFTLPAVEPDVRHSVYARTPKGYVRPVAVEVAPPIKDVVITMKRR